MSSPATPPPPIPDLGGKSAKELITELAEEAEAIDNKIRHLLVRLDAATTTVADIEAVRKEVGKIGHQVVSLRTAIGIVNDYQDAIDAREAAPAKVASR